MRRAFCVASATEGDIMTTLLFIATMVVLLVIAFGKVLGWFRNLLAGIVLGLLCAVLLHAVLQAVFSSLAGLARPF